MLPAILLSVMGALLLLIVCANVSNLVLVREVSRRGEIAARGARCESRSYPPLALRRESRAVATRRSAGDGGRSRHQPAVTRQHNGVGLAPIPAGLCVSLDWTAVGFALVLSCASSLAFGFIPALRSSRVDLAGS